MKEIYTKTDSLKLDSRTMQSVMDSCTWPGVIEALLMERKYLINLVRVYLDNNKNFKLSEILDDKNTQPIKSVGQIVTLK